MGDGFGKNLRYFRKMRRLTQTELAARVGVAPAYISQIEASLRVPSLRVTRGIAEALDLELPALLGAEDSERAADFVADSEKLELLRRLIRAVEFDQENRPDRVALESYAGVRGLRLHLDRTHAVRLYAFGELAGGGRARWAHPGRECFHCAVGRAAVVVGEERTELTAGDVLVIDATRPHALHGEPGCVVVSTTSPPLTGETLTSAPLRGKVDVSLRSAERGDGRRLPEADDAARELETPTA